MQIFTRGFYEKLRWFLSILFFFFALSKLLILLRHGIAPYEQFVRMVGFPVALKYYGFVAACIELGLAVGVWIRPLFKTVVVLTGVLTILGITLSVYSLIVQLSSECGCGLLGHNPTELLVQKMLLLFLLVVLFRGRTVLFTESMQQ